MSKCKNCGETILWARRNTGHGFMPPLNFPVELEVEVKWDSEVNDFVGIPNMASFTTTFHECNTRAIALDPSIYAAESSVANSISVPPVAIAVECPTCGAEPGERCHTIKDVNRMASELHRTRR